MISWDFITHHNRDYDPQNFTLNKYCQALEAMDIRFLHRPVEEVLAALETKAVELVNQGVVPEEEKTAMECLERCLREDRYGIGIIGSPKGASEKKKTLEAHFIGRCYEFALDLKIRHMANASQGSYDSSQKQLVLGLWEQLIDETENYAQQVRRGGGARAMGVAAFRKRLEELLATFQKI